MTPAATTMVAARAAGAQWIRYACPHWALRDVPIWHLYRRTGDTVERMVLGYPGGVWQMWAGDVPPDVVEVTHGNH